MTKKGCEGEEDEIERKRQMKDVDAVESRGCLVPPHHVAIT
jgi:hypothetical protein